MRWEEHQVHQVQAPLGVQFGKRGPLLARNALSDSCTNERFMKKGGLQRVSCGHGGLCRGPVYLHVLLCVVLAQGAQSEAGKIFFF